MAQNAKLGRDGEAIAAEYLESKGYRIIQRNYRCTYGEIDLIAVHQDFLVFVEVKTRRDTRHYHPAVNVTAPKQQRLRRAAQHFLDREDQSARQPRFDVVSIGWRPPRHQVEHLENAF